LPKIAVYGAVPDLALCIIIFSAYTNGAMTGQVSGFFIGLLLDFMSSAPLGLNCLIRTLIGAVAGLFKGAFFLDVFFMPVILCALGTVFKAFLLFILHLILGAAVPSYALLLPLFWVALGLNSLLAPLLFFLLKKIVFLSNTWG
jgi:rod shape-determining protein MreD